MNLLTDVIEPMCTMQGAHARRDYKEYENWDYDSVIADIADEEVAHEANTGDTAATSFDELTAKQQEVLIEKYLLENLDLDAIKYEINERFKNLVENNPNRKIIERSDEGWKRGE